MSAQMLSVLVPPKVAIPRAARWVGKLLTRFQAGPAVPARDRARESADLRLIADQAARTDWRFAADLYAAADRHEAETP